MNDPSQGSPRTDEKAAVTLPGKVEKIIPAMGSVPEKAQIGVEGADDLYREMRVDNKLKDAEGNPVSLKKGAEVEVTIAADPEATTPNKPKAPVHDNN